jgi:hypothetical protein
MKKLLIIAIILMSFVSGWAQHNENITLPERPKRAKYVDYSTKRTGYWLAAQVGAGFSTIPSVYAQFDFVNGYRFSEFLKVGIGISPKVGTNGTSSIPVYAEVRGNIISQEDTMFAFYWNADIGYAINGGFYASPGIGVRFGGIRHNILAGIYYALEGQKDDSPSHMVGFRIGYEF